MVRSYAVPFVAAAMLFGCDRHDANENANLPREQSQERTELNREQRTDQTELARDQSAERREARGEAREELGERTADVQEERRDLDQANRDLAQTVAVACQGVNSPDACPVPNAAVRASNNTDDGVMLQLSPEAGTRADLQHRIECYRARTAMRGAPQAGACIVDLTNSEVNVDVRENNGRVVLAIEAEDDNVMTRIRDEARRLAGLATQRGATNPRNN